MKKFFFKTLSIFNKLFLPRLGKIDMNKLSTPKKLLIAYKYWVTRNVLE